MKHDIEFNLLDEPWIQVLMSDGRVREVSLTDALIHAHEYIRLAGETPFQDAAVERLLLAVLQTVFTRVDEEGEGAPFKTQDDAFERWDAMWRMRRFPETPIREYLHQWWERFWLFHPLRPFYQVPEAQIGTAYGAEKLNGEILESNNKLRLFPAYSGEEKTSMSYAQAARWLVYLNGFDDAAVKPKLKKGEKSSRAGVGWLGKLGLIRAAGGTLFESLMFNLTLLKDGTTLWGPAKPCWELLEARSEERVKIQVPDNAAEILTLQSRRVILLRRGDRVVGYREMSGDFYDPENAFGEQMTVWRGVQEKKKPLVFWPRKHVPDVPLWREFLYLFMERPDVHRPGIILWLSALMEKKILEAEGMIEFSAETAVYGGQNSSVEDFYHDTICVPRSALDEHGEDCRERIAEELRRCEQVAWQISFLAKDLASAAGGRAVLRYGDEQSQLYFLIDHSLREWLSGADNDSVQELREAIFKTALQLGERMAVDAGIPDGTEPINYQAKEKEKREGCISITKAIGLFRHKLEQLRDEEVVIKPTE